jgi:hypothetical protein
MKVDRAVKGRPQLKPLHIGNGDVVYTVESVDYRASVGGGSKFVLRFKEDQDHELWLNKDGQNNMLDRYGQESDNWVNQPVALTCETITLESGKDRGKVVDVVNVAPLAGWSAIFKGNGVKEPKARK